MPSCFASSIVQRAIGLHKKGEYKLAVSLFDQEIASNPSNANAIYYAADCYFRMGDIAKAVILYNALIQKFPGTVPSQYARRALLSVSRSYSNGHEPFEQSEVSKSKNTPDSVSIPFSKENTGHLVVSCLLNGKPQKMIFDTGASVCVATKNQLLQLGIQVPVGGPQGYATGVSGTVKTNLMPIEIQLGNLKKELFFLL